MTYSEQIELAKQKIAVTKKEIKVLQEKKASVTDAAELKAVNKQINAKQEEITKLKDDIRAYANMIKDGIGEYNRFVLGVDSDD